MIVDSFRYLPRSFRSMYEGLAPPEADDPWAPFGKRLAEASVALVTSAGLHTADQAPFDLERERREPAWGDPSYRAIPAAARTGDLGMAHLHVNDADVRADQEVALPLAALQRLVDEGVVGAAAPQHVSVMGYQGQGGLDAWRDETAPAVVELLRAQGTDGAVLAPV